MLQAPAPLLVAATLLSLCSCRAVTEPNRVTDTPIGWWRQLGGGRIAELRPAPPGVGDPYPTLDQVPPRPQPTDAETRRRIAGGLAAQRDQTRRDAANDPLPTLAAQSAPRPAAAPRPDPEASTVVVEAASAPPVPASRAAPAAAPAAVPPDMPAPITPATPAGALPTLADAPPPRPNLAPAAPVAPVPNAPDPAAIPQRPRPGVVVAFAPNSTDVPPDAARALRTLAGQRGGNRVSVSAAGDGGASSQARAASLALGLQRAQAMAAVLAAAGVPADSMRLDAQAAGRGGSARLVN